MYVFSISPSAEPKGRVRHGDSDSAVMLVLTFRLLLGVVEDGLIDILALQIIYLQVREILQNYLVVVVCLQLGGGKLGGFVECSVIR